MGEPFRIPDRSAPRFFATTKIALQFLSGRRDSNPESLVPKTSMLAVTPRPDIFSLPSRTSTY
jgi:hypothetical protein